jgi:S1-C subfamily serine protease
MRMNAMWRWFGLSLAVSAAACVSTRSDGLNGRLTVSYYVNPPVEVPEQLKPYRRDFEEVLRAHGFEVATTSDPNAMRLRLEYADTPGQEQVAVYLMQDTRVVVQAKVTNGLFFHRESGADLVGSLVAKASDALEHELTAGTLRLRKTGMPASAAGKAAPGEVEHAVSFGTAFATNSPTTYATARHVIDGADRIVLHCGPGQDAEAEVLAVDANNDLAVLRSDFKAPAFLELAPTDSAAPGDHVFTMGFPTPDLLGIQPKYSDGAISSLTGLNDTRSLMQITVPIQPGNSGGPLVDARGRVVGVIDSTAAVVSFYHMTGVMPQNVNFAVGSYYLYPLVRDIPHASGAAFAKLTPVQRVTKSLCLVISEHPVATQGEDDD